MIANQANQPQNGGKDNVRSRPEAAARHLFFVKKGLIIISDRVMGLSSLMVFSCFNLLYGERVAEDMYLIYFSLIS